MFSSVSIYKSCSPNIIVVNAGIWVYLPISRQVDFDVYICNNILVLVDLVRLLLLVC